MSAPKLVMQPQASKVGWLGSQLPLDGTGDFTVTRAGTVNRINSLGQTEVVPANTPSIDYSVGSCPTLPVTTEVISNTAIVTELLPYTVIENNDAYVVPKFPNSEFFLNQKRFSRLHIYDSITDDKITELGATKHTCVWASRLIANGTFTIYVSGTGVVHWGDGTTSSYSGNDVILTKVYSNFNGVIYVTGTLTYIYTTSLNLRHNIASLPIGLTFYYNQGSNTTSGSIASLPSGLTFYLNTGQNTTSGSIASLPSGLTYYINGGLNTTSGSIASLPSGLTYYDNGGLNQVNQYTAGRVWANNMASLYHLPAVGFGLTSTMVDNLLIDLANVATWTGDKAINLAGNNAPRTAASTTAVNTLVSKGVSVTTNI